MTVGTIDKRRRRTAPAPAKPVATGRGWMWAGLQIAVLAGEVFALLFLLAQPAFRPRQVEVVGTKHLTAAQVRGALNLPADRSIFLLNQTDLAKRLQALPWVRAASVSLALPDRVSIRVTEWTPSAVLQIGETTYYLNDLGEVLDPAAEAGSLTVINRPGFGPANDGQQALGSELLPMLVQLRSGFPTAFKISVTSFQLDRREVLTAQTDRGWTIIFGQMVTAEDRASLEPKLAALRALSSRIDLISGPIQYINLENPHAPAVQMRAHK
ncbi:MAG TPA: FtsQ-type POTRA domain-containing protein [Candidatus Dormibacteraeota bacterium]|nr:FtsQ-type POTRA domain-containing protein [Candidatus Dormibacteraeota bacterium]